MVEIRIGQTGRERDSKAQKLYDEVVEQVSRLTFEEQLSLVNAIRDRCEWSELDAVSRRALELVAKEFCLWLRCARCGEPFK